MTNNKDCCGCTACLHVCPMKCIQMQEDKEGFLYPVINEEQCIHCRQCEKVCPVQNEDEVNAKTETFVGYCKNEEIRKGSSSGGIFSAIAEWILQQCGVVFGAAFDENFEVHHIAIETREELVKLRGSKYVQSRLENVYLETKQYLEMRRKVLFTGTACQIAGLKKYLNKEYEDLYTVDVLCHGVPSPKIWRLYLADQKKQHQASIEKFEFRNKESGWNNYFINMAFSNGEYYRVHFFKDRYMRLFLGNIDLRPSCYECHFKDFPRISDMTIGDCWGIGKNMPDMDDDKGTSIIMVHSSKGKRMLKSTMQDLIVREAQLDNVLPSTEESRKSAKMHPNRKKYLEGLKRGESFDALYGYVKKNFIQRVVDFIRYIAIRLKP
ncbi:MAG: Coenzyme F420 hydrogenase/dehydrogenase, beta subunit C-terminal domain [Eubacterium sp.]|nr:Coenzyme F420 hydrogenase/dehydrogenase, beta subunit C-terminal domain [Eubacterium sp.]